MRKKQKGSASTTEILDLSEHQIQCAVVDYCALKGIPVFAIPNGGDRHVAVAVKLKKEGVKSGVPDLFVPIVNSKYGGLFIEMKKPKGKLSDVQKFWLNLLEDQGYRVKVCYGVDEAIRWIDDYCGIA